MYIHCEHCAHCVKDFSERGQSDHLRKKHGITNRDGLPREEFLAENFIRHEAGEYDPQFCRRTERGVDHDHRPIGGVLLFSTEHGLSESCECGARRRVDVLGEPTSEWFQSEG